MNSHIYIGNYRITKSNYEVLLDLRIIISKQKKKLCCHHSQQKRLERRIKAESRIPRSRHVVISYATATYFMDTKIRTMNTGAFSLRHRARALKRGAREDHMRVRKGGSFQAGRVQTSLANVNRALKCQYTC